MPILYHRFGQTTIAKVSNSDEFSRLLVDPWLESETIIIKPNFVASDPGYATDSEALRMLLEALDSRIVVTESHMIPRSMNLLEEGMGFTVDDKEVNWKWLTGGGWSWLIENPSWDWFKECGHWGHIKKEDKAFLDERGFTDLFKEFGVEYVNVTDEVWSGRIADPTEVKRSVESRFNPVQIEKLYSMVPRKLYDLHGSTFISFAKLQNYTSFTLKNLFGMIPDPFRAWWHGLKNSRLTESIVGINKVCRSLFNVYGICEALHTTPVSDPEGEFESIMGKYNIVKGMGVVAFGRDPVSLDAIFCNIAGFDLTEWGAHIDMAQAERLGAYDREALKESKTKVGDWLNR